MPHESRLAEPSAIRDFSSENELSRSVSAEPPLLSFQNITQIFATPTHAFTAVDKVTLTVPRGQFCAIVGPSGCGKSTLLNMAAGLMRPTAGDVLYRGRSVSGPNTNVGYITQKDNILPWRTALANVELPLQFRGVGASERRRMAGELLARVGLRGFEDSHPSKLSGGMQKRVALARTLVYEPDTILADEPFGALDAHLKLVLAGQFQAMLARTSQTVLFVTHDIEEAVTLADRVVVFTSSPGTIKLDLSVDIPRPRDVRQVRHEASFQDLCDKIWEHLIGEINEEGGQA